MSLASRLAIRWSAIAVAAIWLLSLVVAVAIQGCGASAMDASRAGLGLSARALAAFDAGAESAYRAHHARVLAGADGMDAYTRGMREWDAVVDAARVAKSSMLAAEAALDAYDEGRAEEASWFAAAACLGLALDRLVAASEAAGAEIPRVLRDAVDALGGMGGVVCPRPR